MTDLTEVQDQTIFQLPPSVAAGGVQHSLLILDQTNSLPSRIPVGAAPLTIGRIAACDVVLSDTPVSRKHCKIELVGDSVILTDLDSRNGTFVDGHRITGSVTLHHGAIIQVASHILSYERQTQQTIEASAALDRDLQEASSYVQSLFPHPIHDGPIRAEWLFMPCTQLGGCGFGYRALGEQQFAVFVLDVPGQGISAAMRAVAVMNLLRQPVVPGSDFANPASVISGLSARSGETGGFFSIWYGVFDAQSRQLTYSSAGHRPAIIIPPGGSAARPLWGKHGPIGLDDGARASSADVTIDQRSVLCLLSNGAWDPVEKRGGDCTEIIAEECRSGDASFPLPLRLYHALRINSEAEAFEDDFCSVVLTFD